MTTKKPLYINSNGDAAEVASGDTVASSAKRPVITYTFGATYTASASDDNARFLITGTGMLKLPASPTVNWSGLIKSTGAGAVLTVDGNGNNLDAGTQLTINSGDSNEVWWDGTQYQSS